MAELTRGWGFRVWPAPGALLRAVPGLALAEWARPLFCGPVLLLPFLQLPGARGFLRPSCPRRAPCELKRLFSQLPGAVRIAFLSCGYLLSCGLAHGTHVSSGQFLWHRIKPEIHQTCKHLRAPRMRPRCDCSEPTCSRCGLIWMARPPRELRRSSELVIISVFGLKGNRFGICGCFGKPRHDVGGVQCECGLCVRPFRGRS